MVDIAALCVRCGAEKDLPLGRCPACAHVPTGEERALAVVCSARVLPPDALRAAMERIRRGEAVRPTEALLARAREVLSGEVVHTTRLTARQVLGLVAANVLVTPLVGYAVWWRYRHDAGPAARQALLATVPMSIALLGGILAWRYALGTGLLNP